MLAKAIGVFESFGRLSREQECERILKACGAEPREVFFVLERQFRLLHNRAQVLLGICGVLVSTSIVLMTGKILGRPRLAYHDIIIPLLVGAAAAEITAAAIVVGGVLRIRWITELAGDDIRAWVMTALGYRDSKASAYRASIIVLLFSMLLFQIAATLAWVQL